LIQLGNCRMSRQREEVQQQQGCMIELPMVKRIRLTEVGKDELNAFITSNDLMIFLISKPNL
jgi:hypothetical protein